MKKSTVFFTIFAITIIFPLSVSAFSENCTGSLMTQWNVNDNSVCNNGTLNLVGTGAWGTGIISKQVFSRPFTLMWNQSQDATNDEAQLGWASGLTVNTGIVFYVSAASSAISARFASGTDVGSMSQSTGMARMKLVVLPVQGYQLYVNDTLLANQSTGTQDNWSIMFQNYLSTRKIYLNNITTNTNDTTTVLPTIYKLNESENLTITPMCSGTLSLDNYTNTTSAKWNGSSWIYSPTNLTGDGATVKHLIFSCLLNGSFTNTSVTVITFRNFSVLSSATATNTYDTPFIGIGNNQSGTYYALTVLNSNTLDFGVYSTTDFVNFTYRGSAIHNGSNNTWDTVNLLHPSIIKINNTWFIYYCGQLTNYSIGLVNTPDLSNLSAYQKYIGNPLITGGVANPSVYTINGLIYIIASYTGQPAGHIGRWVSSDGYNFTRASDIIIPDAGNDIGDPWIIINSKGIFELTFTVNPQIIKYSMSEDGNTWYNYPSAISNSPPMYGDSVIMETMGRFYYYYDAPAPSYGGYVSSLNYSVVPTPTPTPTSPHPHVGYGQNFTDSFDSSSKCLYIWNSTLQIQNSTCP